MVGVFCMLISIINDASLSTVTARIRSRKVIFVTMWKRLVCGIPIKDTFSYLAARMQMFLISLVAVWD